MRVLLCLTACIFLPAAVARDTTSFPPGWNGLARTPPMGWRRYIHRARFTDTDVSTPERELRACVVHDIGDRMLKPVCLEHVYIEK